MRINRFLAKATGISRRAADNTIATGEVIVNGKTAAIGQEISESDKITVTSGGRIIQLSGQLKPSDYTTILLNKPVGYVCSRSGQGSSTVYDLLPPELAKLKPVGRLDKDSSGLLLLTDDGDLANRLTHPKYQKEKIYEVGLDKPLAPNDWKRVEHGVQLEDGMSRLTLAYSRQRIANSETTATTPYTLNAKRLSVRMSEGRNRQIRRTFAACGYQVITLHRSGFGNYRLGNLAPGAYKAISVGSGKPLQRMPRIRYTGKYH